MAVVQLLIVHLQTVVSVRHERRFYTTVCTYKLWSYSVLLDSLQVEFGDSNLCIIARPNPEPQQFA